MRRTSESATHLKSTKSPGTTD